MKIRQLYSISVSRILGICSTSKLIAERSDFKQPAKLDVSGPNAWWPHLRNVHPAWVIWTDGDAALLCSCGKYLEDGSCNPHHTYSWTLNRDPDGHTEQQQTQIDAKITQLCMDPADFKDMKRSWPCPDFDTDALEDDDDDDDDDEDDDDEDNNPGYDKTIGDEGEDDDDEDSNPGGDETVGDGTEDNPNEEEEQAEDEVADADQEEDLTTQDDEVGVETENEPGEEEDEDIGGETEGEETEGEAGQEDEKTEL